MQDHYSTLNLPWGADEDQIRKAYRRLARGCHPDVNPDDPSAGERFKEINAAYQVLSDAVQREAYLQRHSFANELRASWRDGSTRSETPAYSPKPPSSQPGQDILVKLFVSLEDLVSGVSRKIGVKRRGACPTCAGRGQVGGACASCKGTGRVPDLLHTGNVQMISCRKCHGSGTLNPSACGVCAGNGHLTTESNVTVGVPPGAADQSLILIKGQGHGGSPGQPSGDLKVTLYQKEHSYLVRQGDDLLYRCRISLSQWLAGAELRVPSLEGPVSLKIEPGSKSESMLRVRDRGLPDPAGVRGDLLVHYRVHLPATLTRKQLALLKKLEESPGFTPERDEQGFTLPTSESYTRATA
jgi:molecular chaperone DnaJ